MPFLGRAVLLAAVSATAAAAQGVPSLQLGVSPEREAMFIKYLQFNSMIRGGVVEPVWLDGDRFWFAAGADGSQIIEVDPRRNRRRPLPAPPAPKATAGAGKRIQPLAETFTPFGGSPELSPDSLTFILVRAGNLVLRSAANGTERKLTNDGHEKYTWSVRESLWSPDSRRVAVLRTDMRKVHFLPVIDPLAVKDSFSLQPYWLTGDSIPHEEMHIVDVASGKVTPLQLGELTVFGVQALRWSVDGRKLYLTRRDRYSKFAELIEADAATGVIRVVLAERPKTFIEGLRFGSAANRWFTPFADGKRFLWLSERDGFYNLYLYDLNGSPIRQLTRGQLDVNSVEAVDEKRGWIYFLAQGDAARPYDVHLYKVDFEGNGLKRLSEATGQRRVKISPSRDFFIDAHADIARAMRSELRRTSDGRLLQVLDTADISRLAELRWQAPESFEVTAADGATKLYGVLYKPFDFDPSKKYPVLDAIYHGPHSRWAPKTIYDHGTCSITYCSQAYAQLGFIVIVVDARGTPARGKAFLDATYKNFGRTEIPDHVAALRELASTRSYMDLNRVGIQGFSFGGYYALRGLLQAPDVYRVGIVGAPVVDFRSATPGVVEPYLGPVAENQEVYEYASTLPLVKNLKGKLLIVHGTADANAPFSQSLKLIDALVKADRPYDLLILPEQPHMLSGQAARYTTAAVARYLVEHLKP